MNLEPPEATGNDAEAANSAAEVAFAENSPSPDGQGTPIGLPSKVSAWSILGTMLRCFLAVVLLNLLITFGYAFLRWEELDAPLTDYLCRLDAQLCAGQDFALLFIVSVILAQLLLNMGPMHRLYDGVIRFFNRLDMTRLLADEILGQPGLGVPEDRKKWAKDVNGSDSVTRGWARFWLAVFIFLIAIAIAVPWILVATYFELKLWQWVLIVVMIGIPLAQDVRDAVRWIVDTDPRKLKSAAPLSPRVGGPAPTKGVDASLSETL